MNKLWVYGDSFSSYDSIGNWHLGWGTFKPSFELDYDKETWDFTNEIISKAWPVIAAKKLNLELIPKSQAGYSNDLILQSVVKDIDKWGKDDTVVIGGSFAGRITVPYTAFFRKKFFNRNFIPITNWWLENPMNFNEGDPYLGVADDSNRELLIDFLYQVVYPGEDIYADHWTKVFTGLGKVANRFYYWDYRLWKSFETIFEARGEKEGDAHWSLKGNEDFANFIVDKLVD